MAHAQVDADAIKHADAESYDSVTDRYVNNRFIQTCRRVQARGGSLVYPTGALFVAARRPAFPSGA